MTISDRITALAESETLATARKIRILEAEGNQIIKLHLGEPDFNTPDFIKTAAISAINSNASFYTPVSGYLELREAICEKLKRDNDLEYTPEQIICSTGAKQSIANAILALVNPGDEVIILAPYWVTYLEIVKLAGGVPKIVYSGVNQEFKVIPEQLESAITHQTKVILFSSPSNPTGAIYNKEEYEAIAKIILKWEKIIVIADEIYEHINFIGVHYSIAKVPGMYDKTVVINGMSKGFAMTGWRLGYMAASKEITAACDKIQGQFTSAPCSIAQKASIAGLLAKPSQLYYMTEIYEKRRNIGIALFKHLPKIKLAVPQGAFYLFPDCSAYIGTRNGSWTINTMNDLATYLLEEYFVGVVSGEAFGCKNSIRLSFATSDDLLIEGISRIKNGLNALN